MKSLTSLFCRMIRSLTDVHQKSGSEDGSFEVWYKNESVCNDKEYTNHMDISVPL